MLALTVNQPWPWLIAHKWKPVENRSWLTNFRGQFLLHAGRNYDDAAMHAMLSGKHPVTGHALTPRLHQHFAMDWKEKKIATGGIVGVATLMECLHINDPIASAYKSDWFVGPYGFLLKDAQPLPFAPLRGAQKFFSVPDDIVQNLKSMSGRNTR